MLPLSHIGFTTIAAKGAERMLRLDHIDYRAVAIGSVLPDLIDKPIGLLLSGIYTYESRAFGHSLLFALCLGVLTLILRFRSKAGPFLSVFFICVIFHDLLDEMWRQPETLFWPLFGWNFSHESDLAWRRFVQFIGYRHRLLDVLDNISVVILLFFFMRLALAGKITTFFRSGKL